MSLKLVCGDVLQFQETLKSMRDLDDKIIYALNISLPTESISKRTASNPEQNCKELYEQLRKNYAERETVIKECILETANQVKKFKQDRDNDMDNMTLEKKFKSEQRKLRVLKQERGVEDIVKERTLKAFNERCRNFFKADSF